MLLNNLKKWITCVFCQIYSSTCCCAVLLLNGLIRKIHIWACGGSQIFLLLFTFISDVQHIRLIILDFLIWFVRGCGGWYSTSLWYYVNNLTLFHYFLWPFIWKWIFWYFQIITKCRMFVDSADFTSDWLLYIGSAFLCYNSRTVTQLVLLFKIFDLIVFTEFFINS